MPKIPQYFAGEAGPTVGGGAYMDPGAAMAPYEALHKVAAGIGDIGERIKKIQDDNEEALAYGKLNEFWKQGNEIVMKSRQVVGEAAIQTSKNPGVTKSASDAMDKLRKSYLDNFSGSDKMKFALDKALQSKQMDLLSHVSNHEIAQNNAYRAETLDYSARNYLEAIKAGGDVKTAIGGMNAQIDALYPGQDQTAKKLVYQSLFTKEAAEYGQKRQITEAIVALKTKYGDDLSAAIKEAETPEYINKLGQDKQAVVVSSLTTDWKRREDAYKAMANDLVGKASAKIYNNLPLTKEDLQGLRPAETALLEKIKDYQLRQNRAELREKRAEERYERSEERYRIQEAKIAKQEASDAIAGQIIAKIIQGDPIDLTADIYARIPDGLEINKANQVAGMAGKLVDPAYKLGLEVLKKSVPDPIEYGKAVLDFKRQVDTEKAQGDRILLIAESIAKPKKVGRVAQFFDEIWGQTKNRMAADSFLNVPPGTAPVGPSRADLEFTAKKYGITVDEVKRRLNAR